MTKRGPVLVVDDDPDVRETLHDVLDDCGFEVLVAGDGLEALELLEGGLRPRVILLDVRMPRMDGGELRRLLLGHRDLARVPVIVLTADRRAGDRPPVPTDALLAKPVDLDELLSVLARYC